MAARVAVAGDAMNAVPNAHAVLVHFPLGLLGTAVVADLVGVVFPKRPGLNRIALWLWVGGTGLLVAAYLTGRDAAADVRTPGMAHALINTHWTWAWYTMLYFGAVTIGRIGLRWMRSELRPAAQSAMLLVAVLGLFLLLQTADRGGQLVYQHGVGVAAPSLVFLPNPLTTEHVPRK